MKTKYIFFSTLFLLYSVTEATLMGLSWQAEMNVLPGMNNELPPGVINGDIIRGNFIYETNWGWISGSTNDDSVRNYTAYSWSMQLGENSYGRFYEDGLTLLGRGSMSIRNNYLHYDALLFSISVTYNDPVNVYYFVLTLQDTDATTFDTGDEPESFNFSDFEITRLEIKKIKENTVITLAEYDRLDDFNLTVIPEPGMVLLLGLGGLVIRKR